MNDTNVLTLPLIKRVFMSPEKSLGIMKKININSSKGRNKTMSRTPSVASSTIPGLRSF